MSEMLFLYKELTKIAKANELDDGSLKFSVTINGQYADMINELSNRTSTSRAELARHLICTALDEINGVYNLDNDPHFDYSVTAHAEEELAELKIARDLHKVETKFDRISQLEYMIQNLSLMNNPPEEKEEYLKSMTEELKQLKEEVGQ